MVTADHLIVRAGPGPGFDEAGTAVRSWWRCGPGRLAQDLLPRTRALGEFGAPATAAGRAPDPPSPRQASCRCPAAGPASAPRPRPNGASAGPGVRAAGRARDWDGHGDRPKIGFGDISKKTGGYFPPHVSHQKGEDIDIRPVGKGSYVGPLTITSSHYSSERTKDWIVHYLNRELKIDVIFFNDPKIYSLPYVSPLSGHSDHHHVRIQ